MYKLLWVELRTWNLLQLRHSNPLSILQWDKEWHVNITCMERHRCPWNRSWWTGANISLWNQVTLKTQLNYKSITLHRCMWHMIPYYSSQWEPFIKKKSSYSVVCWWYCVAWQMCIRSPMWNALYYWCENGSSNRSIQWTMFEKWSKKTRKMN